MAPPPGTKPTTWVGGEVGGEEGGGEDQREERNNLVGRLMGAQNVYVLFPTTSEYVTLHGKRNFADVIKVIDLKRIRLFWIIQLCPLNPTGL